MNRDQKAIAEKIAEIAKTAEYYPGVVIIHNIQENFNRTEYMSPRGLQLLGLTMEQLQAMGSDYFTNYFNMEDAKEYIPKLLDLVKRNDMDEIYSYFQQVRYSPNGPWHWYSSSVKIILQTVSGAPLLCISFAIPMNKTQHLTHKVSRLLEENNFLRTNLKNFKLLTNREKEIVKQLAKGYSAGKIASVFSITEETVKTHRKNIYQKLKIKSTLELSEYARAFDLV